MFIRNTFLCSCNIIIYEICICGKVLELESERLKAEGKAIGQAQGENRLGSLITRLIQDQRTEEIPIVSVDSKRREQLYKEYNL